jgi:hypothetical protein
MMLCVAPVMGFAEEKRMSDENIITNVVFGYISALTTASIVSLLAMLLNVYSFTLPVAFGVTTIAVVICYWKYLQEV